MPADVAARRRQFYERGATTIFACRHEPRLSYCLYVPPGFDDAPSDHPLLVAVHGSVRTFTEFRDALRPFAEARRCVVLAPLFPVGVLGDDNGDGYKQMVEGSLRYDHALLHMVAEAGARLGVAWDRFFLFGFSGGAQFANRFPLLHPGRLWGVSVAAPGSVTLLDLARDYPAGTRGLAARFGTEADAAALRAVPVQVVVGGADTETWEIDYAPDRPGYAEGINATGRTRVDRAASLRDNLAAAGIAARLDVVPDAGHDWRPLLPAVEAFAGACLDRLRA